MALAGMLSFDVLPVQAAMCSHKFWRSIPGADAGDSCNEDSHYKVTGTLLICADCGEERWEDLEYEWYEGHTFISYQREYIDGWNCMVSYCEHPDCDARDVILLD